MRSRLISCPNLIQVKLLFRDTNDQASRKRGQWMLRPGGAQQTWQIEKAAASFSLAAQEMHISARSISGLRARGHRKLPRDAAVAGVWWPQRKKPHAEQPDPARRPGQLIPSVGPQVVDAGMNRCARGTAPANHLAGQRAVLRSQIVPRRQICPVICSRSASDVRALSANRLQSA